MTEIVIYYRFGGEWKEKEDGSYKWCPRNKELKSIVLLDDPNKVKYSEIVDCIFERLPVSRRSTDLKLSYIPLVSIEAEPKFILDDFDAKCYLLDRCAISQRRSILEWALAYVRTIYPVPDQSEWDIPEDVQNMKVLPPDVTTKHGRIQQTRFPSVGKHRRGKNKRSRKAMIADAS